MAAIVTSPPATAAVHGKVVSADPVDFTPHVQDGAVKSIVQIGDRVYIGGSFTQVKEAGSNKPTITRNGLFAVKATTGEIIPDFDPDVQGGEVSVVLPSKDGKSLYVGGAFKTIGGTSRFVLGKINATTGALDTAFRPQFDARIKDLRLAGDRLYVGGNFATVSGVARPALATVDPATGARDDFLDLQFTGTQNGGSTLAYKMDVSPDESKLVVVGNFTHVAGQRRQQAVMIDLSGSTAQLADWHTHRYEAACVSAYDSYMRDVDFSPDGEFFVITTTGAAGGTTKLCDTQARWETAATGSNLQPTWVNQTGGDTTYAVEITETAVYVGGHFRWSSNPFGSDTAGQGAVSREGIAALDPDNGMPFSWNPGRTRGIGVFDLLATDQGLWMGSDTDIAGGEVHMKLAMFPLAGGTEVPKKNLGKLPGNVYYGGGVGFGAQNYLRHRSFDGTTAQSPVNDATGGIDWRNQRGAFMISGKLYHGSSDGNFYVRDFDGTTFGQPTAIDGSDQLTYMSTWHNQVKSIQGMFFAGGRIYYTRGSNALYYRYFTPQSGVVGPQEWTASTSLPGGNWSSVYGMFVHAGQLYYVSSSDGRLRKIAFQGGVISGSPVVVDQGDWRGRVLFLNAPTPNEPPTASFTRNCDQLECGFNASGSTDSDGTITGYEWDFGDGSTGTGQTASHTYTEAGTYTVKLTVTDNRGDTGTATQQITVSPTQVNIGFRGTDGYNANTVKATVTVPANVQPGDGMLLILNVNGTGVGITPPAGWQEVATQSGIARSTVWQRVAQADDAGKTVEVALDAYAKADLRLLAYSGTSATDPVAAVGQAADPASVVDHTTPSANVAGGGSWVVSYWGDKSSTTNTWTAPGSVTTRATSIGTGSGRVTSLVADSGGAVQTGSYGGLTATTDAASRALMWTIVLARKS
ncbi:PKD domain-containing protein [Thermomonospora echinospora]|uniref:PKD domain-containing protein n=1 Tax=Thermomonospora echinospora TaxID=1992 RepID=UPI001F3F6937|nr:PKD domain-containing protein [Thermomonospora echinospora]